MVFGATGVIGRRLLPLLIADGNETIGVTRRSARTAELRALGAKAVVGDALDAADVQRLVAAVTPDAIIHQLTDLTSHDFAANARLRTVATRHIVDAAKTSGVHRVVAHGPHWRRRDVRDPRLPRDPRRRVSAGGRRRVRCALVHSTPAPRAAVDE